MAKALKIIGKIFKVGFISIMVLGALIILDLIFGSGLLIVLGMLIF